MIPRLALQSFAAAVLLTPSVASAQTGRAETTRHGDTSIVVTPGEGSWGTAVRATEVLRIGNTPGNVWFGSIGAVAALPTGGVVVYDTRADQGPTGEIFSPDGALLGTFARKGSGPGEVGVCNTECIVAAADGSIAIHDFGRRVNFYAHDGAFKKSFPTRDGMGFLPQFLSGPAGSVYLKVELIPFIRAPHTDAEEASRFGFVRVTAGGSVIDTIKPPRSWLRSAPATRLEP
jgi:hypothetical protein